MMVRHIAMLFLLASAMCAVGCKVYNKFKLEKVQPPASKVLGVRLADQTDEGARLEISVELQNPNATALPLVGASYQATIPGIGAVALSSNPNRTLPASGTQTVLLPAAVATESGASIRGQSVTVSGSIVYRPPGEIRAILTESKVPLPTTAFHYEGTVE